MSRKMTAVLFALALFLGSLTFATAQAPDAAAAGISALESSTLMLPMEPVFMTEIGESLGCTYSQCMRHCRAFDEPWLVCHTQCNADCSNDRIN